MITILSSQLDELDDLSNAATCIQALGNLAFESIKIRDELFVKGFHERLANILPKIKSETRLQQEIVYFAQTCLFSEGM